jgi:hypothetical protein
MIVKVITFYHRNPNISKEHFSKLWRQVGQICQTADDIRALMSRYVQHELSSAGAMTPDGVESAIARKAG